MGRTRTTQSAGTPTESTADTQTAQTVTNQDGGQLAPNPETVQQLTADQSAGETLVQSELDGASAELQPPADGELTDTAGAGDIQPPADGGTFEPEEHQPSLVIVNNSPSMQVIPTVEAVIDPYGSFVVPENIVEDADRIQRLKTEVDALNELKSYKMIELRFAVATAE